MAGIIIWKGNLKLWTGDYKLPYRLCVSVKNM